MTYFGVVPLMISEQVYCLWCYLQITYQALAAVPCKRRILLSGTPMQVRYIFCQTEYFCIYQVPSLCSVTQSNDLYFTFNALQNDLEEFFAMVNFTNPGILGDASYFRRYYQVTDIVIFLSLLI